MTAVYIEFPSKPNYVVATTSDTAAQGYLTVLPYDPTKTEGRLFTVSDDGHIFLASAPNLVVDVSGEVAKEGTRVLVYGKKAVAAQNQQWVNKSGAFYSKLGGEDFSLSLEADDKVVISKLNHQVLTLRQPGFAEAQQGQTIIPSQPLTQFTVTAVISLTAPWNGRIVDKITANAADGFLLDIYPAHTVRVISNNSAFTSHVKINDSTPTYLAATYGVAESGVFVNGARTDSSKLHDSPQNVFPIRIGFDSNHQNVFPGTIQRARIYYSALSDAQIQADYQAAKTQLKF